MQNELNALNKEVGVMSGKLDMLLEAQTARDGRYDRHDNRINRLERSQSRILGYAAGVATFMSGVVAYASKHLFNSGG